jgi:Ca2+:H+ antiporter
MAGLRTPERLALALVAALTALAGVANYLPFSAVPRFVLATLALAGLAWVVSVGTDQVGCHYGPAVTGFLQSTIGNLPELFVVVFALDAGELTVAQSAIVGSLLANALLVLGIVIVVGALRAPDGIMRFSARLPNDTTTLLLVTAFIIVLLGLVFASHDLASHHLQTISVVGAACLLAAYLAWLVPYLRAEQAGRASARPARATPVASAGEPAQPPARAATPPARAAMPPGRAATTAARARLSFSFSLALLCVAGVASAFVSDWFVASLKPAIPVLGLSRAFVGIVIVAIAGNAVENAAGVTLAWKGRSDLAISVVKSSVAQIAGFLYPVLVLISLALSTQLTFHLRPVYIGAITLMAIAVGQVTGDGEAAPFEGIALAGLYVLVAVVVAFE